MAELQLARRLWEERPAVALEHFRAAARRHPRNLTALLDAARALGDAHELGEARELLLRVERGMPPGPEAWEQLGQSYRMAHQPLRAAACFERALADPDRIEAAIELCLFHERRHEFDAAEAALAPTRARHPRQPALRLLAARLRRRRGEGLAVLEDFRAVADEPQAHPLIRAEAGHEIAGLLDGAGEAQAAWTAVLAAKEQLRPLARQMGLDAMAQLWDQRQQQLVAALTPELLQGWSSAEAEQERADGPLPCFFTGPPRSGTTLLLSRLAPHPRLEVFDELDLFPRHLVGALLSRIDPASDGASVLEALPAADLARQRGEYFRRLGQHRPELARAAVLIDKNPSGTGLVPLWLALQPRGRVLFARRDPRDVLVSSFLRFLPLNSISVRFLDPLTTARQIAGELRWANTLRSKIGARWQDTRYEDLVEDPQAEVRRVQQFLGLEPAVPGAGDSARVVFNSPSYAEVEAPVRRDSVGRWRRYEFALGEAFELLAREAR